ncbi:MAG: thiamine phosphate synthase [Acidimicrobiaceae bacterium]|nr:thiamine phosphate synthase [Acidimicrobiaceae bacterium]
MKPLLVVTDGEMASPRPLVEVVAASVDGGARAILLREKHLSPSARAALASQIRSLLEPVGGILIVASDPTIPSDGVHLAATDPFPSDASVVGRSCHSPADVLSAAEEGCAYATLSPIFATDSKPGYGPALGPSALRALPLPTWALGGVTAQNAGACLAAGAAGVAVMGFVMRAPDPQATTASLLASLRVAA